MISISYTWVDGGGGDLLPIGFDYEEIVTMNTSASKNYDLYWLAIFEDTPPYRYWSNGWNTVSPSVGLGNLNLTIMATPSGFAPTFGFSNTFSQYTVQFAVENLRCINNSWNNLDKYFIICPSGTGCRIAEKQSRAPTLSPNPNWGSFQIFGLDLGEYQLKIVDISGRTVHETGYLAGEEITLTGITSGLYVASLWKDGARVLTEKLIVNR